MLANAVLFFWQRLSHTGRICKHSARAPGVKWKQTSGHFLQLGPFPSWCRAQAGEDKKGKSLHREQGTQSPAADNPSSKQRCFSREVTASSPSAEPRARTTAEVWDALRPPKQKAGCPQPNPTRTQRPSAWCSGSGSPLTWEECFA